MADTPHAIDDLLAMKPAARTRWLRRLLVDELPVAIGQWAEIQVYGDGYKVRFRNGAHIGSFADFGIAVEAGKAASA